MKIVFREQFFGKKSFLLNDKILLEEEKIKEKNLVFLFLLKKTFFGLKVFGEKLLVRKLFW